MKNVITLGKLTDLLLLFHLLLLLLFCYLKLQPLNVHTKNARNELARPVMETIFVVRYIFNPITHIYRVLARIFFLGGGGRGGGFGSNQICGFSDHIKEILLTLARCITHIQICIQLSLTQSSI